MPFIFKRLVLFMSIAAAFAADKETPFRAGPASSYEHRQTNAQVTIAVDPFNTPEKAKTAFGKLNPYEHGVLPVLVVIQNDSGQTLRLDRMRLEYQGPNRARAAAVPAKEVRYLWGPNRPAMVPGGPVGLPTKIGRSKKNPLEAWEIEGRAFAAQMLPSGNSASGFFYFPTGLQGGSSIYLSGITEAGSGKELLFFEIPLR
jgi:hypothetical protein